MADTVPMLSDERFSEELMRISGTYSPSPASEADALDPYINARLIVKSMDPCLDPKLYGAVEAIQNSHGIFILQFDSRELAKAAEEALERLETTVYAEPDFLFFTEGEEGSAEESVPWNIGMMGFPDYKQYLLEQHLDTRKVVAVLDTGISFSHPMLKGRLLTDLAKGFAPEIEAEGYWDPDEDKLAPEERMGHGTHVAGIVAQCTEGLPVDILPVRILTSIHPEYRWIKGSGTPASFASGITYAVSQGVDVINISAGGASPERSQYLEECIDDAVSRGIVVVVCSGNQSRLITRKTEYSTSWIMPAYIPDCIVVGSVNRDMEKAYTSNYGEELDVMAPGVEIWSATISESEPGTTTMSGTSHSTPHVAAMAAMLQMAYPGYSPAQIKSLIQENALDLGEPGKDIYYGYGLARFEPLLKRTVTYNPGKHGRFSSRTYDLKYGDETPAAPDPLGETGYDFVGWFPEPGKTVSESVVYTALWAPSVPKTGDSAEPILWGLLILVGLIGLAVLVRRKKL